MRTLRVALVLLVLVVQTGTGREPVPAVQSEVFPASLAARYPGLRAAVEFWYQRKGDQRHGLSTPADARTTAAYRRIQLKARKLGLRFEPPLVRQTKPELVLFLGPGIRYIFAMHYNGPRIILVNSWWADRMTDAELEMLMAHELGHAIDLQNERRGHHLLDLFSGVDDDEFVADILAMLMCDSGDYLGFQRKFPGAKER